MRNTSDYGTNKAKTQNIASAYQRVLWTQNQGGERGDKVAGSLERYAAAAQFAEKTQADVGSKSLEQIKESLRRLGAFDKSTGSK